MAPKLLCGARVLAACRQMVPDALSRYITPTLFYHHPHRPAIFVSITGRPPCPQNFGMLFLLPLPPKKRLGEGRTGQDVPIASIVDNSIHQLTADPSPSLSKHVQ